MDAQSASTQMHGEHDLRVPHPSPCYPCNGQVRPAVLRARDHRSRGLSNRDSKKTHWKGHTHEQQRCAARARA